jgi:hypothetical protein
MSRFKIVCLGEKKNCWEKKKMSVYDTK